MSADGCSKEVPDAVGEGEAERSSDDHPRDGTADVAGAEPGAEGAGQRQGDQDSDKGHRDSEPGRRQGMASIGSRAPDINESAEAPAA